MKSLLFLAAVILVCITTPSEAKQPCGWVYINGVAHWVCDYRN